MNWKNKGIRTGKEYTCLPLFTRVREHVNTRFLWMFGALPSKAHRFSALSIHNFFYFERVIPVKWRVWITAWFSSWHMGEKNEHLPSLCKTNWNVLKDGWGDKCWESLWWVIAKKNDERKWQWKQRKSSNCNNHDTNGRQQQVDKISDRLGSNWSKKTQGVTIQSMSNQSLWTFTLKLETRGTLQKQMEMFGRPTSCWYRWYRLLLLLIYISILANS